MEQPTCGAGERDVVLAAGGGHFGRATGAAGLDDAANADSGGEQVAELVELSGCHVGFGDPD